MKVAVQSALLLACAAAAACEDGRMPDVGKQELVVGGARAADALRVDPRLQVSHRGVRRIEFRSGTEAQVAFRERIATDGNARYSIEPIEPIESIPDWEAFALVQRAREGFLFRYRDFVVRDRELFARNWITTDMGEPEAVAGRACRHLHVERRHESALSYDLWTDVGTGLVLASRELEEGQTTASMTYESVEFDPDLTDTVWHQPANQEQPVDTKASLSAQLDARVLEPRLLPVDYALLEAATVEDGEEGRWLKLTYGDGVEPLFFFQRLPAPITSSESGALPIEAASQEKVRGPSSVQVFDVGSARVVQGTVEGFELMVIGKPKQAELLDMIESALP